jgi:hypothetical protein
MTEPTYWYLGVSPISVPYWSDVTMCETKVGDDTVVAPMLFSAREGAEAELRVHGEAHRGGPGRGALPLRCPGPRRSRPFAPARPFLALRTELRLGIIARTSL